MQADTASSAVTAGSAVTAVADTAGRAAVDAVARHPGGATGPAGPAISTRTTAG